MLSATSVGQSYQDKCSGFANVLWLCDAGANDLKPCMSVSTEVTINSHLTTADCMQHCLSVSRLAVATALMELPPDICSMRSKFEGGLLLGAQGFDVTLTAPTLQHDSELPGTHSASFCCWQITCSARCYGSLSSSYLTCYHLLCQLELGLG